MAEGQVFEPLDVAEVSPFIVENHEVVGFLLIPLLPAFPHISVAKRNTGELLRLAGLCP